LPGEFLGMLQSIGRANLGDILHGEAAVVKG
jgi:hypothetical protein